MTEPQEQTKPVEPFSALPPNEAGVSLNWTMIDPSGGRVSVTMRGTYLQDWKFTVVQRKSFMDMALKNGWQVAEGDLPVRKQNNDGERAAASGKGDARQSNKPAPAKRSNGNGNGHSNGDTLQFEADELTVSINSGKTYYKVMGGRFKKFGVTIWPEALQDAGIDVDEIGVNGLDLSGFTAYYIEKEDGSGPQKVVRLEQN
jgi:hypothetical protein